MNHKLNSFEDQKQNPERSQALYNLIQNCLWNSYAFVSIQNEQSQQILSKQTNGSRHLSIVTQYCQNCYMREGDQLYYAGQMEGDKPIGIWRINIDSSLINKFEAKTIFLELQQNGIALLIEQGQIKQFSIKLINQLKKKLFSSKFKQEAQIDQIEFEHSIFTKFKDRVLGCQIDNSEEYYTHQLLCQNLILNDFYFPKQQKISIFRMHPPSIPYFKNLTINLDGSEVVCFGQQYEGKKTGEFFIKFRNDSDSEFQTMYSSAQIKLVEVEVIKQMEKNMEDGQRFQNFFPNQTKSLLKDNLIMELNVTIFLLRQEKILMKCGKKLEGDYMINKEDKQVLGLRNMINQSNNLCLQKFF
ncbi:unnamed protein product [Paramecium pentaurelia]|uniref:Uncharacterized protein n=1 Tax=Paramecium pentaurelia TaxID=43138 RepID=A0A8S1XPM5_9CILI|nr:unnamed protein product [Paramecium pentaurelia]